MAYTLLTGPTGLIGRYLVRDFTNAGTKLVALVRGADAAERLAAALEIARRQSPTPLAGDSSPAVRVIRGDIRESALGLAPADEDWVARNVTSIVHCAADVSFHDASGSGETWNTNVEGTRRLAEFCLKHGIADFSYVSTSFVCGDRTGTIREDELDCGQGFGSTYEKSKFHAEALLREQGFRRLSIFRPCSVTGDSRTGYTSTFHGIYWFAQFTALARMRYSGSGTEPWHHDVRIFKTGGEMHHLVPVDWVSRAIVALHRDPTQPGGVYHLTPLKATTLADLKAALEDYFHFYGVEFVPCQPDAVLNETEELFYSGLSAMGHRYLDGDPAFDCSRTRAALPWWSDVVITHDYLLRIFDYAERHRYGRGRRGRKGVSV